VDVETQRSDWWSAHQQLMAEIDGRRPHRWPRSSVLAVGSVVALYVLISGWALVSGDAQEIRAEEDFRFTYGLLGGALALLAAAVVVQARGGGVEAPQRASRGLAWDQRQRMMRLIATVDARDPIQLAWAADLARRIEAEFAHLLLFAALGLMMLSQAVGADTLEIVLLSSLALALAAGLAVLTLVQDARARAFLRRTAPWRQPAA